RLQADRDAPHAGAVRRVENPAANRSGGREPQRQRGKHGAEGNHGSMLAHATTKDTKTRGRSTARARHPRSGSTKRKAPRTHKHDGSGVWSWRDASCVLVLRDFVAFL